MSHRCGAAGGMSVGASRCSAQAVVTGPSASGGSMSVEPALASRDLDALEESAIRLVPLPDVWPARDSEPAAAGSEPARAGYAHPLAADPGPVLPRQFATFLVEGLAGVRPVRQLAPWLSKRGSVHLHRLMPLFNDGHQPKVLRVLTTRPAPGVVEMTIGVGTG